MARRDLPPGIFRLTNARGVFVGYRVFKRVRDRTRPNGRLTSKRFPLDTPLDTMKAWRDAVAVDARRTPARVLQFTGFAADAARYLEAVRAMPSFADRAKHIGEWIARFGDVPRQTITPAMIRAQRDEWLTIGPRMQQLRGADGKIRWTSVRAPLSPHSVNLRLRALENMWTVLDGTAAPNPVREVPECQENDPQPRGHTFALAQEVLRYMPDVTSPKKGQTAEAGSLSKVRLEVMLWTGLPPVQLARLTPELVDWTAGTITPPRRQKGRTRRRPRPSRGVRARPLLPQAIAALKRFFALGANRAFSSSSLTRSMRRAIAAANVVRTQNHLPLIPLTIRAYDLTRHTFGSEAYRASRDLKAVQELLGHSDMQMTERYALAAVAGNAAAAVAQLAAAVGGNETGNVSPPKTSRRDRTIRRARPRKP